MSDSFVFINVAYSRSLCHIYDYVRFNSLDCVNTELWCEAPGQQGPTEISCCWVGPTPGGGGDLSLKSLEVVLGARGAGKVTVCLAPLYQGLASAGQSPHWTVLHSPLMTVMSTVPMSSTVPPLASLVCSSSKAVTPSWLLPEQLPLCFCLPVLFTPNPHHTLLIV